MSLTLALLALVAVSQALVIPGDAEADVRKAFDAFKYTYNRQYAPAEEVFRYGVFKQNLVRVAKMNAKSETKPFGVTKFMDMPTQEFKDTILMKNKLDAKKDFAGVPQVNVTMFKSGGFALPANFDWSVKNPKCLSAVKNQGQCGSCWAFSGTETVESVCCLAGYGTPGTGNPLLAPQQIVDCDTDEGSQGCSGGYPQAVYEYVQSFGGQDLEVNYPYTAEDGTCNATTSNEFKCPVSSWKWVSQAAGGEPAMQQFVYASSPLSIAVDAEPWQFYSGGVLQAADCGDSLDHAVQITGWATVSGELAWNVRNSWGADWGNNGYIYLQYGQNTCGISTYAQVPCVGHIC